MKNYYAILGISSASSGGEIRSAYRKLAMQYHPDRNPNNKEWANEKFKEINEAYEYLSTLRGRDELKRPPFNSPADIFRFNLDDLFKFDSSQNSSSELVINFVGIVSEEAIMEIRKMLAAKGCRVKGHTLRYRRNR